MILNPDTANPARSPTPYFHREDWCSFALATVLVFTGYWFSLADNVGLGFSGIYSVGANYLGVPHPPGYPVWTIYGWLFTKLLPFSNIAWRLAVSSAVAGALTCGLIALMVSRSSKALLEGLKTLPKLPSCDERLLRMVAGVIAGMTFGFDGGFWRKAVIVDVWPLSILLFTLVICLLLSWANQPAHKAPLVAACFVFGLAITNSQALIPAGLGLFFFVIVSDGNTGRDATLAASALFGIWWLESYLQLLPVRRMVCRELASYEIELIMRGINFLTIAIYLGFALYSRHWLPSWKMGLATLAFLTGLSFYLLVPVFSASNPPINWGYPRTLEGFMHVLNREQYEQCHPVMDATIYLRQLLQFCQSTLKNFGLFPSLMALVPFCFLSRGQRLFQRQLIGLLLIFVSFSLLLVALLNAPPERLGTEIVASHFTATHPLLALWTGYGIVLLGAALSRPRNA